MSGARPSFDDLMPRILSALVMLAVAGAALWLGGAWFLGLIAVVVALMLWELARMLQPSPAQMPMLLGVLAGGCFCWAAFWGMALPLVIPGVVGALALPRKRWVMFLGNLLISGAGWAFLSLRFEAGIPWVLWLIAVVVATDVLGYFAGRLIGGPKLWPRVSPKKTWSGTSAGWVGAALVGICFDMVFKVSDVIVVVAVLISMASQLGDIAESAVKRWAGVKDSSNLIPGHGGVLDRFDGMMAAALTLYLADLVLHLPHMQGG